MARPIAEIEALLAAMERHGIERIELEDAEGSLALGLPPAAASAPVPASMPPATSAGDPAPVAKATIAGRFLPAHPWRAKPFAEIGQRVAAGAIVGLVQVGPSTFPSLPRPTASSTRSWRSPAPSWAMAAPCSGLAPDQTEAGKSERLN